MPIDKIIVILAENTPLLSAEGCFIINRFAWKLISVICWEAAYFCASGLGTEGFSGSFSRWMMPMICPESTTVSREHSSRPGAM